MLTRMYKVLLFKRVGNELETSVACVMDGINLNYIKTIV